MSHHCQSAVITCMDFRLHQRPDGRNYVAEFIKNLGTDSDLIARAGAIMDIASGQENFAESLCRDMNVCAKLHCAETIHLINHEDCGAYAGRNFINREDELKNHINDLHKAKLVILERFPGKTVKMYMAELESGSDDKFIIKEVE